MDIGIPPRPTAATERDPMRRLGRVVVVLMLRVSCGGSSVAWAMGAPGYDAGVTVTADLEGRVYPDTVPYLVGREKVREFARAVGSTDPLNLDVDAAVAAGYPDVVAPPTFAVVVQERTLAQLLADESAGVDFSRVVHGEQRFRFSRPIVAGDLLTATMTVTEVKTLGGNAMVTSESAVRDRDGQHVVTAVSMLVVRADA
jgi:acyl dehydratase